jgi:hypothetical protein
MGRRDRSGAQRHQGVGRGRGIRQEIKLMDFTKWLERPGRSPREMIERQRIPSIPGMPVSR